MSTVDQWTRLDHLNRDTDKGGFQLQQTRSEVNDRFREMMGRLRTVFEDGEWFNLLNESENDFTVTKFSDTTITVTDLGGRDATSKFPLDVCYQLIGDTTVLAQVQSIGDYTDDEIQVTFQKITDEIFTFPSVSVVPENLTTVSIYWSRLAREAGFHPVGTTTSQTPAQIPSIDDLGDWILKDMGHSETSADQIDLDTLGGVHAVGYEQGHSVTQNTIHNGDMNVWQRGVSFTAIPVTGQMTADRWGAEHETAGGTYDVVRESASVPGGFTYALRLDNTAAVAGADKVGIYQQITVSDTATLRDHECTLSYYAKTDNIAAGHMQKVRAAIVKQNVESFPIHIPIIPMTDGANWNATGTLPTLNTNRTYVSSPSEVAADEHTLTTGWVRVEMGPITLSTNDRGHIAVFIWMDTDTVTTGDKLYISGVQLEENDEATEFKHRPFVQELRLCQAFYATTWDYGEYPTTFTANGQLEDPICRTTSVGSNGVFDWRFPVPLYSHPAMIYAGEVWAPTPSRAQANARNNAANKNASIATANIGNSGCTIDVTGSCTTGTLFAHATIEMGM